MPIENQETSTPSFSTTASLNLEIEGVGKPSVALSTEIERQVAEFLRTQAPISAWRATLKVTLSES